MARSSVWVFAAGAVFGVLVAPSLHGRGRWSGWAVGGGGGGDTAVSAAAGSASTRRARGCPPPPPCIAAASVSEPAGCEAWAAAARAWTVTASPRTGAPSAGDEVAAVILPSPSPVVCLACSARGLARAAPPRAGRGADGWLPANRRLVGNAAVRGPAAGAAGLEPALRELAEATVFLVFVPPNVQRELALATWAAGLPHVALVGDETCAACDLRVKLHAPDSWDLLPDKNFRAWPAALARYPQAQFFVKVDTDGYVIAANLFEALELHRAVAGAYPDYMGHVFQWSVPNGDPPCDTPASYASGGAGYVLSRRAATVMAHDCDQGLSAGMEDILVGRCLCRAGILPVHNGGFIAEQLSTALHSWLIAPTWSNHHPDPTIPAAIITLHGYKNERELLVLDALVRAKDASSLRHRRAEDGTPDMGQSPVDLRPVWGVCCSAHPDGEEAPPSA